MVNKDKTKFYTYFTKNEETGCWEWDGTIRTGYGRYYYKGKWMTAHRVSWELHNGPIPDGLLVLHKCDNKPCVNPDHLFVGTQRDNVRDMWKKQRAKVLKGSKSPNSKLTEKTAIEIRNLYEEGGTSYAKLARKFNVSAKLVELVIKRQVWRHV
jgi:hypothetical protein